MLRARGSATVLCIAMACLPLAGAMGQDNAGQALLWDTVQHANESLKPDAVAKQEGWKPALGENVAIAGDACLVNTRLALIVRKGANGAEWYYRLGDQMVKGPTLIPVGADGDKAKALESVKTIDNIPDRSLIEAAFATESGKKIVARFLLKKDKPFVETQPREGTEKILVATNARHAVLPDLFGADLLLSARDTAASDVRFPSENMLLLMTDNGNAMVMAIWRSRDQKARLTLDGQGEDRAITGMEVAYKKDLDMNVWVAVVAAPGIWHRRKAGELHPVKYTQLDWKTPYPALWRANYPREDGLVDSWKILIKKEKDEWEGFGIGPKKDGTVWHAARGTFGYPAYIEGDAVLLRSIKFESLPKLKYKADAYVVIYPYQKSSASPKTAYTTMDVVREALEDTPEFTLPEDVQVKVFPRSRYPGVCYTTGECEKIFDAKEEQKKKREIIERFYKMNFFNVVVRMRIQEYMDWSRRTIEWCAREKAANSQIAGLADELSAFPGRFGEEYTKMKLEERTPAPARGFTEQFIAFIDSNDEKKVEKVKLLGRDTRTIAGTQDHATGVFRMITKEARQRAGYRMMEAKDDASYDFARAFREKTLEVLQNTLGVEGGNTD